MKHESRLHRISGVCSITILMLIGITALMALPLQRAEASDYFCKITFTPPPSLSGTHAAMLFADELKKRTNGKIEPQVFPQG